LSSISGRVPGSDSNSFQEELSLAESDFMRRIRLASIAYGEGLARLNEHHKNTVAELWSDFLKARDMIHAKYEKGVSDETEKD